MKALVLGLVIFWIIVVIVVSTFLASKTASDEPTPYAPVQQPAFTPVVQSPSATRVPDGTQPARGEVREPAAGWHHYPVPRVAPSTPTAALEGVATWYRWRSSQAAAGPALRAALGPKWRNRYVTVSYGDRSVRVRLTDWCACPNGRVIDLDLGPFSVLADPSRGVLHVTVSW